MLKAMLVVGLLSVENGWVVNQDRTEVLMPSMEACEVKRREVVAKILKTDKGAQLYAICRPTWVAI